MTWRVAVTKVDKGDIEAAVRRAAKHLNCLPKKTGDRIKEILKELDDNPIGQSSLKHMVGEWAG
jgi:hypothetical protein